MKIAFSKLSTCLAVAVTAATLGAGWLATAAEDAEDARGESEEPVAQWQHLALTHEGNDLKDGDLAQRINKLGRDGWELVTVGDRE